MPPGVLGVRNTAPSPSQKSGLRPLNVVSATVTVAVSVAVHPFASLATTVYIVVSVTALANGFAIVVLFRNVAGDQEYVIPVAAGGVNL